MRSKLAIGVVSAIVIAVLVGGIAWAVTALPQSTTDQYYACVTTTGAVRSGTVRLNTPPKKCPSSTDVIHSWNAQGPQGPPGSTASNEFRVTKAVDQSYQAGPFIASGPYPAVFVKVTFGTTEFDPDGVYNSTADEFVAPADGYYSFGAEVMFSDAAGSTAELILAVNGGIYSRLDKQSIGNDWQTLSGTSTQHLNAGDTVELWVYRAGSGSSSIIRGNTPTYGYRNTSFYGYRLAGP